MNDPSLSSGQELGELSPLVPENGEVALVFSPCAFKDERICATNESKSGIELDYPCNSDLGVVLSNLIETEDD